MKYPTYRNNKIKAYMGIFMLFSPFFVIFGLVSTIVYFSATGAQRQDILSRSAQGVAESAETINLTIQEAYELTFNFINNDYIMRLLPAQGKTRTEDAADAIHLVRNLRYLRRSLSSEVYTVALFTADGFLFNDRGRYQLEEYFDILYTHISGDSDFWREVALESPPLLLMPVDAISERFGFQEKRIVVPVVVSRQISGRRWTLMTQIKASHFQDILEGGSVIDGQSVLSFDRNGSIIVNTTGHNFSLEEIKNLIELSSVRSHVADSQISIGNETAHLTIARAVEGIRLVMFTPETALNSAIRSDSSNQMIIVFFVLAMVLFFILTLICVHKMYKPVRSVIQFINGFQERTGIQIGHSFYSLQFAEVDKFYEKKTEMLYENLNYALKAMVCMGNNYNDDYLESAFLDLVEFKSAEVACLALQLQFNEDYLKSYSDVEQDTLLDNLPLNLSGIFSAYFPCYVMEFAPQTFLCFLHHSGRETVFRQKINSALVSLTTLFQQTTLCCTISCGLSKRRDRRSFLHSIVMEAVTALGLALSKKENFSLMVFEDAKVNFRPIYTFRERNVLLSLMKSGEKDKAVALIDEILSQNKGSNLYQPIMQKIMLSIYDTGPEYLYDAQVEEKNILALIASHPLSYFPYETACDQLKMFLQSCMNMVKPEILSQGNLNKILDYITNNYQRDLYLENIAAYFSINPKHLSRSFKEKMGVGLPEYINQLRVVSAKKLLVETDDNVTDIGSIVGFENRTTFFRSFKKIEGMSPSDYRKTFRKM